MFSARFYRWGGLVAILVAAISLPRGCADTVKGHAREALSPVNRLVTTTARRVRGAGEAMRGWGGLPDENRKLGEEVIILRNQVAELSAMEAENTRLREQLAFMRRSTRDLVPAEVIARDISGGWQTVRLSKGFNHHVRKDQPVLSSEGLVGRVREISLNTADVLLISDPSCRVSVEVSGLGVFGVLRGKGASRKGHALCEVEFITKDVVIPAGTTVVTSGLGERFPKGVLIGVIEHVETDSSGLFQRADVMPAANLGRLTHVFVAVNRNAPEARPDPRLILEDEEEPRG